MRRGRPRKPEDTAGITWTQWQRFRGLSLDPRHEEPVGRLAFLGQLTAYQWDAVELVSRVHYEHAKNLGLSRWAASPSFEVGIGRSPVFETENDREKAEAVVRDYNRIQTAISPLSRDGKTAFYELIIRKLACSPLLLPQVRDGLDRVAAAFGAKAQHRKKRLDISRKVAD